MLLSSSSTRQKILMKDNYICLWSRLCQTAFNSGVGALRIRTFLLGRLWGLQPPVRTTSTCLFSLAPFGEIAICNLNSVGLFLTLKQASAMLDRRSGSSVTKRTRSLEIRVNTSRSVKRRAQDGCKADRPSTFARAPPKSLKIKICKILFYCNLIKTLIWE